LTQVNAAAPPTAYLEHLEDHTQRREENAMLKEKIQDVLDTHHTYLRRAMPRISRALDEQAARDPLAEKLRRTFENLRQEMEIHMMKEERILFPAILRMEEEGSWNGSCGLEGPVAQMIYEHENANREIAAIGGLSAKLAGQPELASVLGELEEFRRDLEAHIAKEEQEIFPAALGMRQAAGQGG
jgi:regulator of cell morphogenesis and NO signaling